MSATDLERRLADVLRQRADQAMAESDTQSRHQDLMRELRQGSRRDGSREDEPASRGKRAWVAGVAAAAAVAVVVSLPALLPRQDEGRQTPARVPEPSAVRVAREFVDAWASFDRARAASYLAEGAELHIWPTRTGEDVWRRGNRWFEATGGRTILRSCRLTGTSALGTLVECAFDWHALQSDRLGEDPFVGGLFMFTVRDDEVVAATQSGSSDEFSVQMWDPFEEWVTEKHPKVARVMYADWPANTREALSSRSIELWRELTREWVEQQRP